MREQTLIGRAHALSHRSWVISPTRFLADFRTDSKPHVIKKSLNLRTYGKNNKIYEKPNGK